MSTLRRLLAVGAVFVASFVLVEHAGTVLSAPRPRATPAPAPESFVKDQVLVKFRPIQSEHRLSAVAVRGHTVLADLDRSGWTRINTRAGQTVAEALASYQGDPSVEAVQPNYVYRALLAPNDPSYGQLWGLKNIGQTIGTGSYAPTSGTAGADINIENAWDHITDCSSVVVAVIDSGVNYNHEDLAGNMWDGGPGFPLHGTDFVSGDDDPMDLAGHGTHVAATIGAVGNNATGTTGVCWVARIMALRVLDATGSGTTAGIVQAVNFAVSHGAKVINMSLGGGSFDQAFSDALNNARANDVVVVVAAGNSAFDNDLPGGAYPCKFTHANLICVAALDQNYSLATFSNYGATSVDVGAPGTNVLSAVNGTWSTITDNFNSGGTLNWTTSGGGWAYRALSLGGSPVDVLANPTTFPSGTYSNNANQRAFKTFTLGPSAATLLSFSIQFALQPGDFLKLNYRSSGGDPFAGGVALDSVTGFSGGLVGSDYDISACASPCSVGFQLSTNASGVDQGVGIAFFAIDQLTLNNTTYDTFNGTSMASPHVAGLAALLRAYNPQFTYVDVANAIKNGGRSVPALAGKTTSGRAADAMSSLAYINAPTALRATLQ